jgi:hypothetical protein
MHFAGGFIYNVSEQVGNRFSLRGAPGAPLVVRTGSAGESTASPAFGNHTSVIIEAKNVDVVGDSLSAQLLEVRADTGRVVFTNFMASAIINVGTALPPMQCAWVDASSPTPQQECGSRGGDITVSYAAGSLQGGSVRVNATQELGAICLGADTAVRTQTSNVTCATRHPTNGTSVPQSVQCSMEALLSAGVPRSAVDPEIVFSLTAAAVNGAVRVHVGGNSSMFNVLDGGAFSNGITLDVASTLALGTLTNLVNAVPNSDVVAAIDAGRDGRWLFATRSVFLELQPYLLTALSASLMTPRLAQFHARIFPGRCSADDFLNATSVNDFGAVSTALRQAIFPIVNDVTGPYSIGRSDTSVDGRSSLDATWIYSVQPQGGYSATELSLAANPVLAGAVLASIGFAAIIAILLMSIVIRLLRAGQQEFALYVSHREQMTALHGIDGPEQPRKNPASALRIKVKLSAVHHTTSIGYFSLAKLWYLTKLRPIFADSLGDFIRNSCVEYDGRPPTVSFAKGLHWHPHNKRFRIPLNEFLKQYDLFCQARGYRMRNLGDSARMLAAGYGVVVNSERIAVLTGIKFKSVDSAPTYATSEQFGDNWLQYFVHELCLVTNVLSDTISEGDFVAKFAEFCRTRHGPATTPSREDLASICKALEVSQESQFVSGVCWKRNAPTCRDNRSWKKATKTVWSQLSQKCGVLFREIFLTCLYAAMIIGPPIPVILLALWVQTTYNYTHSNIALSGLAFGTVIDFLHRPWILIRESSALLVENRVCVPSQ